MPEFLGCPSCGSKLAGGRVDVFEKVRCGNCGAVVSPSMTDWNPYEAPSAPVEMADLGPTEIPRSVLGKFTLAFQLFVGNLGLFALIILTVRLPANLAIEYLLLGAPAGRSPLLAMRSNGLAEAVFGPISSGALIYAVAKLVQGGRVGYGEAMGVGFRNWGRLFVADLIAGLIILLSMLLLVVPGIIMAVRYSLVESAVILEHASDPRARSTSLTIGRRWSIFFAGLAWYLLAGFAASVFHFKWTGHPLLGAGMDALADIVSSLITIVLVLFYMEARQDEQAGNSWPDEGDMHFRKMSDVEL